MKPISKSVLKKISFRGLCFFMMAAFLNLTISCNYFKVKSLEALTEDISKDQLQKYQAQNKYFILHNGSKKWHITITKVDASKKIMECLHEELVSTPGDFNPDSAQHRKYMIGKNKTNIVNEIHISTTQVNQTDSTVFSIPLSSISRIDVIEKDTGRNIASYSFLIAGSAAMTALLVLAVIGIIIALTKSSCPFVYVNDNGTFIFKGEIYGGAIYKPLERDDYIHLKNINANEHNLEIKISNELHEVQYTNLANAILVEHDLNSKVFIDDAGKVHSVSDLIHPQKAVLNDVIDFTKEVSAIDSSYCLFNNQSKKHFINDLNLRFAKPENARQTKLILHAKNSLWLDFAFGKFTELFGSYYGKFMEKQRNGNRDTLQNWTVKQGLPLSVFVKKNNEWKLIEHIPTVGPLAARDICVPIDVSDISSPTIEIKISCGFMFWELDFAAMDFSTDENISQQEIQPQKAIDEKGFDVASMLSKSDANYLVQPQPGNTVLISYKLPELKKEKAYDVFLHSRGYYEHVRNYAGLPDKKYLETFKQEGAFIDFSKALFDKVCDNSGLSAAK